MFKSEVVINDTAEFIVSCYDGTYYYRYYYHVYLTLLQSYHVVKSGTKR